jgi:ATP-dependent DNA helicase RecG
MTPKNDPEHDLEKFIERRRKVTLDFIKMNNKISATEIAEILKVNSKTIKRDLQQLKNKGIIERVGSERGGYWKIKN